MDQTQHSYLGFEERARRAREAGRDALSTDAPADYDAQMEAVPQFAFGIRVLILVAVTLTSAAMLAGLVYGAVRLTRMAFGA